MNIDIIVGCGFGDESKGTFTNYRVKQSKKPLVVRFNGGHQCGHTVVENGIRHVFSNFGSGTLAGAPTYWSEYCTFNPLAIKKEGDMIRSYGIEPRLIINSNAMATTPLDIYRNMQDEKNKVHGTVGVGFGATIQRNEDMYHLYARDLLYPAIRNAKLIAIQQYVYQHVYQQTQNSAIMGSTFIEKLMNEYKEACDDLVERFLIVDNLNNLLDRDLIFEGGQGIMLDMDYGFFPNVTRSNTTAKNAIAILKAHNLLDSGRINTYYITRAYGTRHGNGYLPNEGMDISYIKENPLETNVTGTQGDFRKAMLDLDTLRYAVTCDKYHNPVSRRGMVITCLDQLERPDAIPVTIDGQVARVRFNQIAKHCNINFKYPCFADTGFDATVDFNGTI